MNIIFDEKSYAEKVLSDKTPYVQARSLYLLVAYYKHLGLSKADTIKKIKEFCLACDQEYNFVLAEPLFRKLENSYKKANLKLSKNIPITQTELDIIRSSHDYKKEKLLFVMLVLAKYKYNGAKNHYLNNVQETKLYKYAKVSSTKAERDRMIYELNEEGLISTPYDNSKTITINYVDDGDPVIIVTDLDNMVSFYPFYCEKCGKTIEQITYKKKICDECYEEKRLEDVKNNMKHMRSK